MVRVAGEFVEADGGRLAEIHRWLARVGGDFDEYVTVRQVVAGKAVFFGADDEGDATAAIELVCEDGSERGERKNRLLGFAMSERAGTGHKGAACYGIRE